MIPYLKDILNPKYEIEKYKDKLHAKIVKEKRGVYEYSREARDV